MQDNCVITDIHSHVLPDIDDGPSDMKEANELLSLLYESGVDRLICTSHYMSPHFDVEKAHLAECFNHVTEYIKGVDTCPTLQLGAEVRLSSHLLDDIITKSVPTLGNTPYVLVEFPGNEMSNENVEIAYELTVHGYSLIMAHPERNFAIQKDNRILEKLLDLGIILQLTAGCFIHGRHHDRLADKLAWSILKNGQATVIASDTHNSFTRPPTLLKAYKIIEREFGEKVVEDLIDNANAIWNGRPCSEVNVKADKLMFSLFKANK